MKNSIKSIILILTLLLNSGALLKGQCTGDNIFVGTTDNDWGKSSNWSAGCVPGGGSIIGLILIAADCVVSDALNHTFHSLGRLEIASGITLTNNGSGVWWINIMLGEGTYIGDLTVHAALKPGYVWNCGDPLVSVGQLYQTVQIGSQCWMAENLNVGIMINGITAQTNNATIEKYCYDDNPINCTTYGGLYQWDEMMQYSTTESTQGICPTGWHLPSDDEFKTLEMQLGMTQAEADAPAYRGTDQGSQLAGNASLWSTSALVQNAAFNSSGFVALPGGNFYSVDGQFYNQSLYGLFWVSSDFGTNGLYRHLRYDTPKVGYIGSNKNSGLSVRCVQD